MSRAKPEPAHRRRLPVCAASRVLCNVTQQPVISAKAQCLQGAPAAFGE